MKIKDKKKPPLLIEGELLLEKGCKITRSEVHVRILDVTHIDAESDMLTELIVVLAIKKNQTKIPFEIFGPVPNPSKRYIVVASISAEKEKKDNKTLYRTTQSIPVFREGYPEAVTIPLTKIN